MIAGEWIFVSRRVISVVCVWKKKTYYNPFLFIYRRQLTKGKSFVRILTSASCLLAASFIQQQIARIHFFGSKKQLAIYKKIIISENGEKSDSKKMVKTFQQYLPETNRTYSCVHCRAHLASHDELISKSFQGSQGRAYLFNSV